MLGPGPPLRSRQTKRRVKLVAGGLLVFFALCAIVVARSSSRSRVTARSRKPHRRDSTALHHRGVHSESSGEANTVPRQGHFADPATKVTGIHGAGPAVRQNQPDRGSEPLTTFEGDMNYVRQLQGPAMFKEIVLERTSPVLVMFYNPDCGHCRTMMPYFNGGTKMVRETFDDVRVVSYPVTSWSDDVVKSEKVRGVPDIRLYPMDKSQESIKYRGSRSEAEIFDYVREHQVKP